MSLGILTSLGVFIIHVVKDKEDKLRYLLNFAGMRPSSYFIGLMLADLIIFTIP